MTAVRFIGPTGCEPNYLDVLLLCRTVHGRPITLRQAGRPVSERQEVGMASTAPSELHVPLHPVRCATAASLFDGHDAAINVMRRLLQAQGAEVVHLGHDRSVDSVVRAAL